jgi:PD-(D/E)XK nuclease superfamily
MQITNKYDLPQSLVNAVGRFSYSRGKSDISVTQLIDSPRIVKLKELHGEEIVSDISEEIWRLVGSALHLIAESNTKGSNSEKAEERIFSQVGAVIISGGIDMQRTSDGRNVIGDYKFTSAYAVMQGKIEWERQLNCYAWLVEKEKGVKVDSLEIYAIVRDWNKRKVGEANYPIAPIVKVPIELWPFEKRDAYIKRRVLIHTTADENTECSDKEMWKSETKWAVVNPNLKRAIRVCNTEEEAINVSRTKQGSKVERRDGRFVRCEGNYCSVAQFCSQWSKANPSSHPQRDEGNGNGGEDWP